MTKLLPKRLHVAAVGFAAAVGASGATILPFAVGAIAQRKGVTVSQLLPTLAFLLTSSIGITTDRSCIACYYHTYLVSNHTTSTVLPVDKLQDDDTQTTKTEDGLSEPPTGHDYG